MHEQQTEVMVAGAGPVGLLTALMLSEAGVKTLIIDRESRTATGSCACALHQRTLRLLDRLGVLPSLLEHGRRVQRMAFYDGAERRAELDLAKIHSDYPFLLILPQGDFENALEMRLLQKAGIAVHWNHRFDDLQPNTEGVRIAVEKLGGTSTGYIVPHWETVVQKRFEVQARFLIGADGHNSLVRSRLGLDFRQITEPEIFAAYEFESESPAADEVRVVLDDTTTNVLWPLPGKKHRWTFQLPKGEAIDFPEKERSTVRLEHGTVDDDIRQYVQRVASRRAPWFSASVREVTWCTDIMFGQRLASSFGSDRCWLAGDSAHQTGPVGAQSMNVGMLEAESLVQHVLKVLRHNGSLVGLQSYNQERQAEWSGLLGMNGGLRTKAGTNDWVRTRAARILPCIPAAREDLQQLASQLQLDVA